MAIQITDLARTDLENIRTYTAQRWGKEQWLAYYRELMHAFERIESSPHSGRDRSLFVPGMRSINCGKHVIFHKCLDALNGAPVILRIVHQRQHMPALVYYDDLDSG